MRIVVTGPGADAVAIARGVAERVGSRFLDASDGLGASPLPEGDRWAELARLRASLRNEDGLVVACGALERPERDLLRGAEGTRFVVLDGGAAAVPSDPDELDLVCVAGSAPPEDVLAAALAALSALPSGPIAEPILAEGGRTVEIGHEELAAHVARLADAEILGRGARRILLVPPDHTRLYSRAGEIVATLYERLSTAGCDVWILPAVGTHFAMTPEDVELLFGKGVPYERILHHRWRDGLARLGEISADEIAVLSRGRLREAIPVEVDSVLVDGWDMVVSVGQVVPHEVIGMANFTKNLVVGLGGAPTINRSHFLGAASDMETIMGRASSPVRDMVDAAFDRFVAPRAEVLWILTVMEDTPDGVVERGLFAGRGRSSASGGAAYRAAAALAAACNITEVAAPLERVACWLDPHEFHSTWLGNKAIYRTRMAIADGGELVVLAPGVRQFGEDDAVDRLIRRHGYRGTEATLAAMSSDPELAANLGAAAHLIHGSSEGRFRVVYCTDPAAGGLTREEVEGAGLAWRSLPDELERLGIEPGTPAGDRRDRAGDSFFFIANPALGLWADASRLR